MPVNRDANPAQQSSNHPTQFAKVVKGKPKLGSQALFAKNVRERPASPTITKELARIIVSFDEVTTTIHGSVWAADGEKELGDYRIDASFNEDTRLVFWDEGVEVVYEYCPDLDLGQPLESQGAKFEQIVRDFDKAEARYMARLDEDDPRRYFDQARLRIAFESGHVIARVDDVVSVYFPS